MQGGTIEGGTFKMSLQGTSGTIVNGTFEKRLSFTGAVSIQEGTFKKAVQNHGTISGGTFEDEVINMSDATISKGTFYGMVYNMDNTTISGGTFNETVYNRENAKISGGDFKGTVNNESGATISDGNFYGTVDNSGTISGGHYVSLESITGSGSVDNKVSYDLGSSSGGTGSETGGEAGGSTGGSTGGETGGETEGTTKGTADNNAKASSKATPHTHSFEWTVTKEPTKNEDGLEEYRCKGCGAVEASQPISANMVKVKELYGLVKDAPKGGAVAYDFGDLATISDYVLAKMAERNDVAVTVSFTYGGEAHSITFPAGTDYAAVLTDADTMYGFYGVAAKLGLTVE